MDNLQKSLNFLLDFQVNFRKDVFDIKKIYINIYKHITTLCCAIIVVLVGLIGHLGPKSMIDRDYLIFGILGFGVCIILGVYGMYYVTSTLDRLAMFLYDVQTLISESEEVSTLLDNANKKITGIEKSQDEQSKNHEIARNIVNILDGKQKVIKKAELEMQQGRQTIVKFEKINKCIEVIDFGIFVASVIFILAFIIRNI